MPNKCTQTAAFGHNKFMNKKYKLISQILLAIGLIALFAWYFFPYISYKAFFYSNEDFHSALELKPVVIDKVQSPPEKWEKISISNLTIQLPLFESVRLSESEDIITFYNNSGEKFFTLMLKDKNKETFDFTKKNLFSGITISDEQFNIEIAQRNIIDIFEQYKSKAEQ